jgi:pilus assembly protein Flp/PilA
MRLISFLLEFLREEEGQDLIEYALLVALIALVAVGALITAGSKVNTIFTNIGTKLGENAGS